MPVLLVCDAGYVSYELIRTLLGQGCSFLIRLSSQAQLYSDAGVEVATFHEGQFWYWTDTAEKADKPPLRVRVIRVASRKRKNDVWLVTDVLDPQLLSAKSAGRLYRMRWESECFFKTYKRVVKDISLVSETTEMVGAGSRGFAAGVPVAVGARGVGVEDGWAAPAATRTSAAPRGCCGRSGGNWRRAPSRCRRPASGGGCKRPGVIGSRGPVPR